MTTIPRVLVIDDDPDYRDMLSRAIRQSGYKPLLAETGTEGAAKAKSLNPDFILLDIHMPGLDGIKLHRVLRRAPETSHIPIILLTGKPVLKSMLEETCAGLGAEPVHHKMDSLPFLVERIRRALAPPNSVVSKGSLRADLISRQLWIDGVKFPPLPAKRFDLLCALMRRDGPASRTELLREVWADQNYPKIVDMTVLRLRKDLRSKPHIRIQTARHAYTLIADPRGEAGPSSPGLHR